MGETTSARATGLSPVLAVALGLAVLELAGQWTRVWTLVPDLSWGWLIPCLVAYLAWVRWLDRPGRGPAWLSRAKAGVLGTLLAVVGAFGRFALEPFPGWPLAQWSHALAFTGLMLLVVSQAEGCARARHFAWVLLIPLAALPWPAFVAQGLIGSLRTGLASIVAEILNATGEPARSTGTVIEVGRGLVGIDEACGGIRSLQTAVLIGLVIGELRRDRPWRRLLWLAGAVATALVANAIRIGVLVVACAKGGPQALERWHDRAGTLEIVFTLGVLGAAALRAGIPPLPRVTVKGEPPARSGAGATAWTLIALVLAVEGATFLWFGPGAKWAAHPPRWTAHLPTSDPSFSASAFTASAQDLLQCNAHEIGTWNCGTGRRAGYMLRWERGHFAQYAVRLHRPEVCLTFAGSEFLGSRPPVSVRVGRLTVPFFVRDFRRDGEVFHVYFVPWNLSSGAPLSLVETPDEKTRSWAARQWDEVRAHRRSLEAIEVAYAIFDLPDPAKADAAFRREITALISPE